MIIRFFQFASLLVILLIGCRSTPSGDWPVPDWKTTTPADEGMDTSMLNQMLTEAEKLDLDSLIVIRHGHIVAEAYYSSYTPSIPHDLHSVTKSFVATLMGIAIDKGVVRLNERVLPIFSDRTIANIDKRKREMTIEHLLSMTSGLDWHEGSGNMYTTSDWVQYMLDLPMVSQPGTVFNYCTGCSHLLMAILEAKTGVPVMEFARQSLFDPLGIIDPDWDSDPQKVPFGGMGLYLTPREMAKLGYLYLHNGMWNEKQVVPAKWVRAATQAHANLESDFYPYGYQWWINPKLEGYAALGGFGQMICVLPKLDILVVFTADSVEMDDFDEEFKLIQEYVVRSVSSETR
jgi:CubicO group peptidase (beta-lactamase class C family)